MSLPPTRARGGRPSGQTTATIAAAVINAKMTHRIMHTIQSGECREHIDSDQYSLPGIPPLEGAPLRRGATSSRRQCGGNGGSGISVGHDDARNRLQARADLRSKAVV